jgi:uracil phosphoribosyltransferase
MSKVVVVNHPLIQHKLSIIRDYRTGTKDFREALNEISGLITYEISRDFETQLSKVTTPIQETTVNILKKDVVIVPILRAGLGMVDGIHNMIPTAKIGHVGLYRDEESLQPVEYYAKFPPLENATVLVVDPMLATGGSASSAVESVKKRGAKDVRYVGLVGCPEGVARLQADHPDVDIYLAALDERLNEVGYIVPGLGDCGDRLFGTK